MAAGWGSRAEGWAGPAGQGGASREAPVIGLGQGRHSPAGTEQGWLALPSGSDQG